MPYSQRKVAFQIILVVMVFTACISKTKEAAQQEPYFSIKDYLTAKIDTYETQQWQVMKEASVNNSTERDTLVPADSSQWAGLLSIMMELDINKPAYLGQYEITVDSSGPHEITRYRALKDDLNVQEFEVARKNGDVKKLSIKAATSNVVYGSEQNLIFYPDSLYTINAGQEVMTGDNEQFGMRMEWKRLEQ